jgi:hypothetical protein
MKKKKLSDSKKNLLKAGAPKESPQAPMSCMNKSKILVYILKNLKTSILLK